MNDKKYLIALNYLNPKKSIYVSEVNYELSVPRLFTFYERNAMRFPLWMVDNVIDYLTTLMINIKDAGIRSISVIPVDE